MSKHLTPFQVCERLIGPPAVLGPICGYNGKAAYLWARPSKLRTAGDIPTTGSMRRLLAHSAAHGRGLTEVHLVWGATEDEVAAILAARDTAPAPAAAVQEAAE